jgi:hypothetical protein
MMSGEIISTGVTLIVAGGTAIDLAVQPGGTAIISAGIASSTTISGAATLNLIGGTSVNAIIQGNELVSGGSSLNDTVLGGGFFSASNGVISNLTISSGGSVLEFEAGYQSLNGLIVGSGGIFEGQSVTISNLSAVPGGTDQVGQIFTVSGSVTSVLGYGQAGGSISNGASIYLVPGTFYYGTIVQSGASVTIVQSYTGITGNAPFYDSTILSGGYVSASGGTGDNFNVYSNTVSAGGTIFVSGIGGSELADTIAGTVIIGSGATTSGSTVLAGGMLVVSAAGTDNGTTDSGTLIIKNGAVVSGTLGFAGSGATIELDGTSAVTIGGFDPAAGETIFLSALPFSTGATVSNLGSALVVNDGAASQTIYVSGLATGAAPVLTDDAGSLAIACYAAGTRIATARGAVPVEQIAVGEMLMRAHGGSASVIWVGRRTLDLTRHAEPEYAKPVRVLAGAIEPGRPARDLVVSPRHALCIDGALYEAISLINGATIRQEHDAGRITYHHLELAAHDVIIAEGQPAESYVDRGNRHMFEGQASLWLHPRPDEGVTPETCLPVHRDGPALEALRMRLIARALGMGFVSGDAAAPEVLAGGRRLRPMRDGLYVLPPGLASVVLRSAPFYAGETTSALADKRRLGTALRGARLLCGVQVLPIDLGGSRHRGMYRAAEGTVWTDGNATLALPAYRGTAMLQIDMAEAPARLMRAVFG